MGEEPGAVRAPALDDATTPTAVSRPDGAYDPEDPQQLRVEIERTRQELGDTVAALAEKTDVKARAKEKVAEVRQNVDAKRVELMSRTGREPSSDGGPSTAVQVREKAEQNPVPTAALAAFVGGFLFGRLTKRD
jgi:hypothetical protein